MAKPRLTAAGGLQALLYTLRKGKQAGGMLKLYRRMRSRNTCKTCALGMGGQRGGMVNESGHFPEVCKKSLQAQVADMQGPIAPEFFQTTPLALMEKFTPYQLEHQGRLTFPLIAEPGDSHYRPISWDEALGRAQEAFAQATPDQSFFYASGRSSNEAAFLMQLVARAYGTANIHNCSYYCHQPSGVALSKIYGSGTASVTLEDLVHADVAIVVGANPPSNHPRLLTQLMELKRRGGKVLVINPLRELGLTRFRVPSDWRSMLFGTEIADLYLQPHIGADIAVFKALLKGLIERGGVNQAYVDAHTNHWDQVAADANATSWDTLVAHSGVAKEQLDAAIQLLHAGKRGIAMWAMGLTHHTHGVDNILALGNVMLALGWLGELGVGMMPIRGHSNVQGIGSMGVTPALKQAFAEKLAHQYGIPVAQSTKTGQHTHASMQAAHAGNIQAAFLLGGNLYASNPDSHWAAQAMRRIPTTVNVSTTLNTGHIHGRGQTSMILPARVRDEEVQLTTQESLFNYVRVSDGGVAPPQPACRSEVDIICSLAEGILPSGRFDWKALREHRSLRAAIAAVVPGYAAIENVDAAASSENDHAAAKSQGPGGAEFQIAGRTFHNARFATANGNANFHLIPLPQLQESATTHSGQAPNPTKHDDTAAASYRLMTLRSEGQFNSVVYEEADIYRGNERRDVVMMAQVDARRQDLTEGQRVVVRSSVGELEVSVAVVDIRAGNLAMYYPEANVLVPQTLDPQAKTPAFKSVAVTVAPAPDTSHGRRSLPLVATGT